MTDEKQMYFEPKKSFSEKTRKILCQAYDWLDAFVIVMVIIILLFTFVFRQVGVDGPSMMDTLQDGDRLIISDFLYTPGRGDIIVISRNFENVPVIPPNEAEKPFVKRIIALPGETVDIKGGHIYIDGNRLPEDYVKEGSITSPSSLELPFTVPPGQVFFLGDNRERSNDSRNADVGTVDKNFILGRVVVRFFPFNTFRIF